MLTSRNFEMVGIVLCQSGLRNSYQIKTRNTVSNAHKMIPPAPPCFAYFTVGNLKIMNQIKCKIGYGVCHHVTYKTYKDDEIL